MPWVFTIVSLIIINPWISCRSDSTTYTLETPRSWDEAVKFCSSRKLSLSINGPSAENSFWIGKYRGRTPWTQMIGCFNLTVLSSQEFSLRNNGVTSCFNTCYNTNSYTNQFYFALQNNRCVCLGAVMSLAQEHTPLQCSIGCPTGSHLLCGGKSSLYSVYRTDFLTPFKRGDGPCHVINKNGNILQKGCDQNRRLLCEKIDQQGSGGNYLITTMRVLGLRVMRECQKLDARVPHKNFSQVLQFIEKLTETEFWIGQRIYYQTLILKDIKPVQGFTINCVARTVTGKENITRCQEKLPFYCTADYGDNGESKTKENLTTSVDLQVLSVSLSVSAACFVIGNTVMVYLCWRYRKRAAGRTYMGTGQSRQNCDEDGVYMQIRNSGDNEHYTLPRTHTREIEQIDISTISTDLQTGTDSQYSYPYVERQESRHTNEQNGDDHAYIYPL